MNQGANIEEIVNQWLEKADNDLRTAKHTLMIEDHCPFDTVCFHLQQAVEKYCKAFLISKNIVLPKSHDLTEIIQLFPGETKRSVSISDLAELNPYAVEARYPGPWEPITHEDAIQALEIADKIISHITILLNKK
jgi:HEPN domain-containing protein